jgi:c(7)-type cytochrome triheme protein
MSRRWLVIVILLLIVSPSTVLHAVDMGGGMGSVGGMMDKLSIQTQTVGKVVFSHSLHGTNCNTCHPTLFKKKNNSNHVTMELMERGRSCGACHNGQKAFSVTGDCTKCHAGDIVIQTKAVGKVMFSHDIHSGLFGCDECHPDLFKPQNNSNHATMKAMADGASCGACHDGGTAFGVTGDCATCHAGDILYKDADNGNVVFPHTAHLEMFGCDECHPDVFKPKRGANKATMEAMESGKSCGACHDGDTAFGVAEDCESCHEM